MTEDQKREQKRILNNIKRRIREKGLKQKFIAEQVGITAQKLNDILNGRGRLTVGCLLAIAKVLDTTAEELVS